MSVRLIEAVPQEWPKVDNFHVNAQIFISKEFVTYKLCMFLTRYSHYQTLSHTLNGQCNLFYITRII